MSNPSPEVTQLENGGAGIETWACLLPPLLTAPHCCQLCGAGISTEDPCTVTRSDSPSLVE